MHACTCLCAQAGVQREFVPSSIKRVHVSNHRCAFFSANAFVKKTRLLFWDERAGFEPTLGMPKWSSCDLHCLDWNETDTNLLVTGTADGETRTSACLSACIHPCALVDGARAQD